MLLNHKHIPAVVVAGIAAADVAVAAVAAAVDAAEQLQC